MDRCPPNQQRPRLLELLGALDVTSKALRRDECGDWRIKGRDGHIYAGPGGYLAVFMPLRAADGGSKAWGFAKRRLTFAAIRNDGDGEGVLSFDRLPTPVEAEQLRDAFGIRKRRAISAEAMAAGAERLAAARALAA